MASVSHKLRTPLEGALAGGGDPATSPLYVFGPFLSLIVGAKVGSVTFGASIWMVVLTVVMVSAMYRLVMGWVVDGSGGSGLNEEEFGGWAVKVNAAITFIEYTLTFLVSMAALVTFLNDRFPQLDFSLLGVPGRTVVGITLSLVTAILVNHGPRVAALAFGPATAGVLLLLWVMIVSSLWKYGLRLPSLRWESFQGPYLHFTLAGYTRLLALMTGIEIFANLVAAYDGEPKEKSRKAFSSLVLIMGTTCLTMLVVGPTIFSVADPLDASKSVFTQTMDHLLAVPAAYLGTLVGICVLLSACAASAQGLQNLSLGLRYRHYIPAHFGQRNRFDVSDKPVWLEVLCVAGCFLLFGTQEETYLSLYAAGVFVLLSLTGWAAAKRLLRESRRSGQWRERFSLAGTVTAALLTSLATILIFAERFSEGVWLYFVLVPALYWVFGWCRGKLGEPSSVEQRLGQVFSEQRYLWVPSKEPSLERILLPLDATLGAEQAFPVAKRLARAYGSHLTLVANSPHRSTDADLALYLQRVRSMLEGDGFRVKLAQWQEKGSLAEVVEAERIDLLVWASDVTPKLSHSDFLGMVDAVGQGIRVPILCLKDGRDWRERFTCCSTIIVGLDGSELSEQVLPYACALAKRFDGRLILASIPEGSESESYSETVERYLAALVESLLSEGIRVETQTSGSGPARTLLELAGSESADLIAVTSHGRGGREGARDSRLGSVTETLLKEGPCPVLLVPALAAR